ncbi:MAG: DUF3047 domain-containing protein [Candidatus Binataceae bacterium]|jgi:hypothetical protein
MRWYASCEEFRAEFSALIESRAADLIEEYRFVEIPANRPPWTASGIKLAAGDRVSLFCAGRAWHAAAPSAWVGAHFSLWIRVGTRAPIFRPARGSASFTAATTGELYLANLFPGEWADLDGKLRSSPEIFTRVAGAFDVLVIRWRGETRDGLERMAAGGGRAAEMAGAELRALLNPACPPSGWKYLWEAGDAECFSQSGENGIRCEIVDDAAILQRTIATALTPATRLRWSWKIDKLPSARAENSVATHDYLSVAVEFDNGRDLTYIWSATLEPERSFDCPISFWRDRETHYVVRSGASQLGRWVNEERSLMRDYERAIGPAPSKIVAVWLIAVGIFQHVDARCEIRAIELVNGSEILRVS